MPDMVGLLEPAAVEGGSLVVVADPSAIVELAPAALPSVVTVTDAVLLPSGPISMLEELRSFPIG